MIPNNPAEVLLTLDHELDHHVSLVLYGRAALCLGFENPPPDFQATLDVDAIITLSQLPLLMEDFRFWDALDRTNSTLRQKGLYLTHLFSEDQVFLRPDWERHIVPITRPETRHLRLFRPHALDLIPGHGVIPCSAVGFPELSCWRDDSGPLKKGAGSCTAFIDLFTSLADGFLIPQCFRAG